MDEEPAYKISVSVDAGSAPVDEAALRRAIESALVRHDRPHACISVAIVDDARMAELNQTFLDKSGATDVIAFDLRDSPKTDCPPLGPSACDEDSSSMSGADPDGELVLSIETAARQAKRRGHSTQAELMLYAVHGTLHLLGYDDHEPDAAKVMHAMEDVILSELGVGAIYSAKAE